MSYCYCDASPAEFYSEREYIARKTHICGECKHQIMKGETYQVTIGKWEGEIQSNKRCIPCADLAESLRDVGICDIFGDLFEDYHNYLESTFYSNRSSVVDRIKNKHKNMSH